jgi:hypothetical protein
VRRQLVDGLLTNLLQDVRFLRVQNSGFSSLIRLGDVQPFSWDSKDKEIFAMLDEICIANKQNPLSILVNRDLTT